jgi:hypothetical protein
MCIYQLQITNSFMQYMHTIGTDEKKRWLLNGSNFYVGRGASWSLNYLCGTWERFGRLRSVLHYYHHLYPLYIG